MKSSSDIRVGCCGFPSGRKEYFRHFKLVEIQQTFYKMPEITTVRRWRDEAPDDFEFTVKASQLITHPPSSPTYRRAHLTIPSGTEDLYGYFRPTDQVFLAWEKLKGLARVLQARVILFQCPASFSESPENIGNMRGFFRRIADPAFIYVWEVRGTWQEETVRDLCTELGLVHGVDPFTGLPLHGEIAYFRLHGGAHYRHRYSEEELTRLKNMLEKYPKAYVLFNNLNMRDDARTFMRMLEEDP
ncbi:MAG: DUF72 domain-containing protein [Dehalococcoidales bacterium]|nr:DUF72 domain-containing protein [Dehalococcoidales bacterium]